MGELIYGSTSPAIAFDDRALAHLQAVIGSKMRRRETFFFTWTIRVEHGGGRESMWIDPAIPLRFVYTANTHITLNREWIELLARSANSATGLQFVPEPAEPTPPTGPDLSLRTVRRESGAPVEPAIKRTLEIAGHTRQTTRARR